MTLKPVFLVFMICVWLPTPAGAAPPCSGPPAEAPTVRLVGIDAAGDPLLTDGRTLRLIGIAARQDAAETARFAAGVERWRDIDLKLAGHGAADRWGRLPARLWLLPVEAQAEPRDIGATLIAAKAAQALPEPIAGCPTAPKVASARTGPGEPARPALAPDRVEGHLDGHDVAALKAQAGRLVTIEGRIASVGERAQRTYLNFSRRRAEAGSIVLSRKLWRELQDAGWTAARLAGKRIRARGVLSGQDGLLLEATSALALDLID